MNYTLPNSETCLVFKNEEPTKSISVNKNGDIFVNGELCTDNNLIVETLREILKETL